MIALVARVAEKTKHTRRQFNTVMDRGRRKFAKQKDAEESIINKHFLRT